MPRCQTAQPWATPVSIGMGSESQSRKDAAGQRELRRVMSEGALL